MIRLLCTLLLALPLSAHAADAAAPEDDDDELFSDDTAKKKSTTVKTAAGFEDEEDIVIPVTEQEEEKPKPAKVAVAKPEPAARASGLGLDLSVARPLADNWAPTVVASTPDAVVVEMPVLYSAGKATFDGKDWWLVAEVFQDGKKLAENRAFVNKDSVGAGASVQFFRLFVPIAAPSGVLEVKISRLAAGATKNELVLSRTVQYNAG